MATLRRSILFVLLSALAHLLVAGHSPPLRAQANSPAAEKKNPFSLASLGLKGTAMFKAFSHFHETNNDSRNFRQEGILQLEWAPRLSSWSRMKILAEIREDNDRFVHGVTFKVPEKNERRSILNLKEATASFRNGPVELSLGKQIFAWGTAELYNPTDNLNPYDYLDVIDHEKLGVYSASLQLDADPATLTVVVVPFFTPSRIPLSGSRWTPSPPKGFAALIDDRALPSRAANNMQYAARIKATLKGWDLSASYFDGFEHTPVVKRSTVEVAPSVLLPRYTPVFTRMRVPGFDFSTTYRKLEFHGEAAFKVVEKNGRDSRFQGVLGLNYSWDVKAKRLEQIAILLEYARQAILSSKPDSPIIERGGLPQAGDLLANNAFRNALAGRIIFKFSEETHFNLSGTVEPRRTPNYYIQLKLTHKLTDAFHIEPGLDFIGGDQESLWGRWRDNDRFFVFLKYFF